MKSIPSLDSLLFDPLSWIHPRRLPLRPGLDGVRTRSIINGMIIKGYGWSIQRPELPGEGPILDFVTHWRCLPQVALLIAAHCHRAALSRQGRLLLLPAWVRQFAELNIVGSSVVLAGAVESPGALLAWGKNELTAYGQNLPEAIRQRISLLFSSDMERQGYHEQQTDPCPLLIKLAFQHAKRNPDTPDAAEFRRCFD